MSPKRTSLRFAHRADIYAKSTTTNDTGQLLAAWTLSEADQKCYFTPSGSAASVRVSPTMEEADYYTMIFPHDAPLDYGSRLENIRSLSSSTVIYSGPLQVVQIDVHVSYSGKAQFLQVKAKSVIE